MVKLRFTNDSFITEVNYDTDTKFMMIHFKTDSYECAGVPREVYDAFEQADSKGKYFNANVKGKYNNELFD